MVTWVSGQITLIIFNVTIADEGVYSCGITSANAKEWKRNIKVEVVAPATITNVSSDKALLEGSDLQLFCIASGRPTPNITWVKITSSGGESDVLHRGTT
ncbi:IgLON member [Porites harrisoni]